MHPLTRITMLEIHFLGSRSAAIEEKVAIIIATHRFSQVFISREIKGLTHHVPSKKPPSFEVINHVARSRAK